MKTKVAFPFLAVCLAACFAALLFCAGCASAGGDSDAGTVVSTTHQVVTTSGTATVIVTFNRPEKFTDLKSSSMGSGRDRAGLMDDIRDYVVGLMPRYLSGGRTFSVTFNDIDMAGEYEPWLGVAMQDVRIIKGIYPPRIALDFSLKDAGGAVIASGSRTLTDMNFMSTVAPATVFRDDRLRYEKTLLNDWLRGEFTTLRRSGETNNNKN